MSYGPFAGRIAALVFLGFAGRLLILSNANLVAQYVDPETDRLGLKTLTGEQFVGLLAVVTFSGFVLMSLFRVFFSRLSARAVSRLYDEVTLRTSRLPMRFFDTNPVGRIVTRFSSDYGNVFRLFGGPLAEFLSIIFDLIAMLLLVAWTSWWLLFLFLIAGLLQGLLFRINQRNLREERRRLAMSRGPSIAHFAETAQGVTSIRIYDRIETFLKRFQHLNNDYLRARKRTAFYLFGFSLQMGAMTAILLLAAGGVAIWSRSQNHVPVAVIGSGFAFIMLSSNSLQMFFDWLAQFEEAMTGVERLADYLHRELEPGAQLPQSAEFQMSARKAQYGLVPKDINPLAGIDAAGIEFKDVWFRYDGAGEYVLKGVSFQISPGEKIGIVGKTGSGKSSLIQALYHFYPIDKGSVAIGGVIPALGGEHNPHPEQRLCTTTQPFRIAELESFRRSISYISQDPTLFRGTLRDNLDIEGRHADDVLIHSLKQVELGAWYRGLRLGLSEPIEERGRNLSSGERQLLCMARCLLQNAPVVVLDEATSAIDPATEAVLVRATHQFFSGKTQLIIAHRLSTLTQCDRVIWIHEGRVRMVGFPDEVLSTYTQDYGLELQ